MLLILQQKQEGAMEKLQLGKIDKKSTPNYLSKHNIFIKYLNMVYGGLMKKYIKKAMLKFDGDLEILKNPSYIVIHHTG